MTAADKRARSFAERRITKSATRCRWRSRARSCLTVSKSRRANCAAWNRRACFAARKSSGSRRTRLVCSSFRRRRKSAPRSANVFPNDTVLNVEITPNRADLLSHYGLAREIAALTKKPLREPKTADPLAVTGTTVQISAPDECPFYSARRIENITVGAESGLVARETGGCRAALDQQHCRHYQLRDA